MSNKKEVLKYVSNFDKIVHADFLENDKLSNKLVDIYKDYIFKIDINRELQVDTIKLLDKAMGKYIDDYVFRNLVQKEIHKIKIKNKNSDIISVVVSYIIHIYLKYEDDSTRKIYISKWI